MLWGQSLRFGAVEAMYHPLVLALEGWLGEADDAERASVIEAVPGAALILPSLGASPADGPSMLMMVVDALLSRVVARGPTVLVVDDVQWADPATWDALSYLVAGFGRQRLALVTTHRDEAAVSEQFQHWLGNVRRLPGTEELVLTRLDQDATGDQIAVLLGRPPPPRLVEQVYDRSRGNPYFSELLVRRGDLDSSELPDDLPDELSQALLDAWRGMSAPAREITRDPRHRRPPDRPADARRPSPRELGISQAGSVREAVDAGVVVLGGDGAWFRHPLLAGVLAETYLPGEAAPVHAAWARPPGVGLDRRCRRAAPARRPRVPPRTGRRRLRGVRRARSRAPTSPRSSARAREAADLLARAADLWEVGADAADVVGHARLLERAGHACDWVGRARDGYRLLRSARDLVSPERDPLWASRLTVRLATSGWFLGESQDRLARGDRAGRGALPRRRPTAASTPRRLPAMRTSCSGTGGLTRRAAWSRTPWRPPTARALPQPSARPIASARYLCAGHRPPAGRAGLDGLLGTSDGLGRALRHRRRALQQAELVRLPRVTCAVSTSMRATTYEWFRPSGSHGAVPERRSGRGPARRGRPRGGRGHRARWSSGHRRRQQRGPDPAPRGGAGGATGRRARRHAATWPAPTRSCPTWRSSQSAWRAPHRRDPAGR